MNCYTVYKAALAVTANNASKTHGEANPEFTLVYNGFVNNEDETVLDEAPIATCEATAESDAGTYDIVVSGGTDNNYVFIYTNATLTITAVTGIKPITDITLNLYPNPTSSRFQISGFEGTATVNLYNLQGKLVQSQQVTANQSMDVSSLTSGTYVARVQTENGIAVKSIIKE